MTIRQRGNNFCGSVLKASLLQISSIKVSMSKDNLTAEQKELAELRKRNKQLEMENDILKQAALILGRK